MSTSIPESTLNFLCSGLPLDRFCAGMLVPLETDLDWVSNARIQSCL